jgi:hypothetical protein
MKEEQRRYVGLDIGKRTYAMAVIGKNGKVSHSNGRTNSEGRVALYGQLSADDKVALEAGNLALIYGSMKKTDKEDALKLARIAVANLVEEALAS